ncbi:MAG: SDR family NAD(P)-dependent oxidoreductase [Pseudomonadota bacterium]|uniref:SDR family NAD(P)-dependent oxidoreductase n=1 Tax=Rhizorhabdus phycosphaerae TaxID=2711156 RepID=UPI0013ECD28F|nr:SDR family NAD(P)-dependent oxidoreductase [Rhizorhabdus phycosphaerae]
MSRPLEGKRALVTGSSAGLGEGIALRLAEEGADVCLHGRNEERLAAARERVAKAGGAVHAVTGSLSDDAGAKAVFDGAVAALGGVDILVNNAGGESAGGGTMAWLDTDADIWNSSYNSNVGSIVRLVKLAVPGMREAGWGRLIQLSSESADFPMAIIPDYQAAKLAIRSLTRSLAMALARTGITSNSISPGLTHSTGPDRWLKEMAKANGWADDWESITAQVQDGMISNFAGRIGEPADIAHVVAFLADPRAGFVNGIDIAANGGR